MIKHHLLYVRDEMFERGIEDSSRLDIFESSTRSKRRESK